MKTELNALYALQQIDSAIDALKREFAALDAGQGEAAARDTAKKAHDEAAATLSADTASLHDVELEQKTVLAKKDDYEKKLYSGSVTNPRELMAMQEEVEMLERMRTRLDEKILGLVNALETHRSHEAQTKKTLQETTKTLKAKQSDYKQHAQTIADQARALLMQRKTAEKSVPAALLQRYETLRIHKNGLAIVALEDGNACGGCKMGLPTMLVQRVHEGSHIEVCQNCKRILCEAPKVEEAAQTA